MTVLPGITVKGGFSAAAPLIPFALFRVVTQLISSWSENIRTAHRHMAPVLAVVGSIEESPVRLLLCQVADPSDLVRGDR